MKNTAKISCLLVLLITFCADQSLGQRRGAGSMRGFRSNASSISRHRSSAMKNFRSNSRSITSKRGTMVRSRSNTTRATRHVVYKKTNRSNGKVYYGRTSGHGNTKAIVAKRDRNHHMNKAGYSKAVPIRSSTNKAAIRGVEDRFIARNSQRGRNGNAIKGISSRNPRRAHYHRESRKVTRRL